MRKSLAVFTAAAATAAVALLSACSSGGSQGPTSTIPSSGSGQSHMRSDISRSGISPKFQGIARAFVARVNPDKKKKLKDLYVSDFDLNAEEILANKTWTNTGSITSGIDGPDGNWVDSKGNLYVANYAGIDITEYAPGSTSPTNTYSSGMSDPVAVTTDSKGNVYEGDYLGGYVGEYAQGSNTQTAECSPGGDVEGIAVDKSGDVFVAFLSNSTDTGQVDEYKGGLSGCSATKLGVTVEYPGGMVLDKHSDLVLCDQDAEAVDIIKPPYSSVSGTLGSGYSDPFHVTVNKKNKQAYVGNYGGGDVLVLSYPGGTTQATLGSSNGLEAPAAAVDSLNYNPK